MTSNLKRLYPSDRDRAVTAMQLYAQGLISKRTAMERVGVIDVDKELLRIEKEGKA